MEHMRSLARTLFDFFLPPSRADRHVADLTEVAFAAYTAPVYAKASLALFPYRTPVVRDTIWALKYRGNRKAARLLAGALWQVLAEELGERRMWQYTEAPILVPMPLSKKKRRERGFNQNEYIAESLLEYADVNTFTYAPDALKRIRNTRTQTGLSKKRREENVRGAFVVNSSYGISHKTVILLDDVVTTGATMQEARRALEDAGANEVICIALAH